MNPNMHEPVLLKEILDAFDPRPGQTYIDATVNGGGHARAIAERVGSTGRVIGIDWDCDIIRESELRNTELGINNISLVCDTYRTIEAVAQRYDVMQVDGILFDLGFSSYHTDQSGRGFAFSKREPLDMRYHPAPGHPTAADIVNRRSEQELADILTRYGEECFARRIARRIVEARKEKIIASSEELADIVRRAYPVPARHGPIHPATRTFQALRIAVNDELGSVEAGLPAATGLLAPKGILAVISFHSLEDRVAKNFMREYEKKGILKIQTPKPVRPGNDEVRHNPRARSARLRVALKV